MIVRNLVFHDWPDDAINVQMFSHHVWLDQTPQRNPRRVRFGEPVHIYNNYYTLDDPNNVRTVVMAGAGVGKI